ncbi:hypothetical protein EDB92DRAFT_1944519 [Lactarius akahatsu]|uniref:GH15-like domain-containing protein n=1 Tax=Lactarius akahatsu TaxID=416441 RepID=A0AAD4QEE9_9AGAM|nr:hypothetical protein EDB92DRAFT_1944519 [Lactarius akahatsu]
MVLRLATPKYTNNTVAVRAYFEKFIPTSKDVLLHELLGSKVGADPDIIVPIITELSAIEHPGFTVYWLRDACRVYHTWLNELTVPTLDEDTLDDTKLLRAQVDDSGYALIRSQQVVSLAGNVFTLAGGLEEAVFDIHIGKILVVLGPQQLTFWNEEEGFMTDTTVTDVMRWGRSGKGSVPITVSVFNFDPNLPPDRPRVFFGFYPEEQMFGGHARYFGTLYAVKHLLDALIMWDLIARLQVTNVSLKDFRQLDQNVKVGTYRKGSDVYENLTDAITNWAEKALLLADRTPDDHVLPLARDKEIAEPVGPRCTLPSLVAALDALDVWWDHGGRFHQESRGGAGWWGWWDVWSGIEGQFNVGL